MTIQDEQERLAALNPAHSYIVQAPAGSGKTELLTQRFLVLLGLVKQPEEILAITFTKKSSAEMRDRIIKALQNALTQPEPETMHSKKTWQLAKKVLQQDALLQWDLLASPNRLRIQTIDSFNSSITRQLPLLSHFGAPPEITDDANALYREAVQEFLAYLESDESWSGAIATILSHMDNNLNDVESLLVNLLAKRDQWLRYITLADPNLRVKLEGYLAAIVTSILTKLKKLIPQQHVAELLALARYAADNLIANNIDSVICSCRDLTELPSKKAEDKEKWLGLRELLVTGGDDWRKQVNKNAGFPAESDFKNPEEKNHAKAMKARMMELLKSLNEQNELLDCFKELKQSPEPTYRETQWQTLEALHQVLHVIVAQLRLTFQIHGKIDYIENALAAVFALGTTENPTDLTLALDYQIKHILVDEFQDTSNSQFSLLEKITSGWENGDGRTLFLVGDPMQSIYRFREAEVGLFIRARKQGIGQIRLQPLTLSVNFRSANGIVDWVNNTFEHVFPSFDDVATGAVSYSPSIAFHDTSDNTPAVRLDGLLRADRVTQAEMIVSLIKDRKKLHPKEVIAILVRSRTHLTQIIPALKAANLSFRAIDIDSLTDRPFIQDLIALTRALLHPADRIAWFSILRAPWCGMTLTDLLTITRVDVKTSLWELLSNAENIKLLSADGQQRLSRVLPVLKSKLQERKRVSLRAWIESTWLLLGGPACVEQPTDLEDAAAFFELLEGLDQGGDLLNLDSLADKVEKLFAAPNHAADETLQIMTIHNSKGLEFDTVILPHLECKASNDDKQLLLWMELPRDDNSSALILAPVHAIGHENDTIYDYIKTQHAAKNDYERSRLLYVAVTRAKKHLYCYFNLKDENRISSSSLLKKLLPVVKPTVHWSEHQVVHDVIQDNEEDDIDQRRLTHINRLITDWKNPVSENRLNENLSYHQKNQGFLLPNELPRLMGTLIHQILQQIGQFSATWWIESSDADQAAYIRNNLLQLGVLMDDLPSLSDTIKTAIRNSLEDSRGKWILSSHKESQVEYPITALIDGKIEQLIIDRTFVDEDDVRWIIDYKSSVCEDGDVASFLEEEQKKYQKKMFYYFQALREVDGRRIKMGLYFPLMCGWKEWEFEEITS